MKKITAILCTLALLMAFTGCNNDETPGSVPDNGGSVSAPESTTENTESPDISESEPESSDSVPESTSAQAPHNDLSEQAREILERCTLDLSQVTVLDEITLSEEDIVDAYVDERIEADCIEYGVGFYRIARPLYYSETGDDYDIMKELMWEKMDEFEADTGGDVSLKEARVGDTLENGLTVKEAKTVVFGDGGFCESYILLGGELTMEGVLYREMQDHDYMFRARDLTFSPDCTKSTVPTLFSGVDFGFYMDADETITVVVMGCATYFLGNLDEIDFDEQGIFGDGNVAKVKVTVDNIKFGIDDMHFSEAEIVDIERID